MGLQQQLDAFKAEFARTAPAGRPRSTRRKSRSCAPASLWSARSELATGRLTSRRQTSTGGRSRRTPLEAGPAVVTFYRGGWGPYCNIQLRAYQAVLPEITALGGRLVAISPQLPDGSLSTAEANKLTFDVLSDIGNRVARSFGLVWTLSEELRAALRSSNKALPEFNGDDSWELPVPATYVIARDRRVALAGIDVNYRERLEPDAILSALRSLRLM